MESRIWLKQWKNRVAEFGIGGGLLLALCVWGVAKEIAAGPDNLTFLCMFWRWLLGVCV